MSILNIKKNKITKKTTQAYLIKGVSGDNETFTKMGNFLITPKGYLVLFATETKNDLEFGSDDIHTRNLHSKKKLAMTRILSNCTKKESNLTNANVYPNWKGEEQIVSQNGKSIGAA